MAGTTTARAVKPGAVGMNNPVTPDEELAAYLEAIADLERRGEHDAAAHFRNAHGFMMAYFHERAEGRIEEADPWLEAATVEVEAAKQFLGGEWP
jgi:hypothetical protein